MTPENDEDQYLNELKCCLIKSLCEILIYTFVPFFLLYFLRYLYLGTEYSFLISVGILAAILILVYVRCFLSNRNLLIGSFVLVLIFFFLALFFLITRTLFLELSLIAFLLAFVTSLFLLSEGVAFILFSIFFVLFTLYVTLEPNQLLDIIDYESELCLQLKTYWMFLLLMYLIYKGTVIMKQCYHVHISATQKYKSLALIEYEHRLLGKVSKCILHDIATPLSVIGGSIKLLSAKNQTKKEKESIKSSAYNSLNYLESILDNSLNLLRDNRRIDVFNPDLVIKEMLRMVDIRIKKSNIFIMKSLLADCKINGNKASFSRVFLNVIINSIEELENLSNIKKMITLESCVSQNNYVLKIVDSGNGIKDGIVENLSRGHISTKDGCHSGLGLYFVFTTIEEEFNGEVKIISKKNRYTKVILSIPLG